MSSCALWFVFWPEKVVSLVLAGGVEKVVGGGGGWKRSHAYDAADQEHRVREVVCF